MDAARDMKIRRIEEGFWTRGIWTGEVEPNVPISMHPRDLEARSGRYCSPWEKLEDERR
jgi:hypothetical protein